MRVEDNLDLVNEYLSARLQTSWCGATVLRKKNKEKGKEEKKKIGMSQSVEESSPVNYSLVKGHLSQ